jgi:polyphosphate kinase
MSETMVTSATVPALHDPSLYTNRELSWLEFNQRVLDQAVAECDPLLERVKFLAIVGSNLDEFFMVRVATLLKRQRAGLEQVSPDGLTVSEQLVAIRQRTTTMLKDQAACWAERLRPALAAAGIRFLEIEEYTDKIRSHLSSFFKNDIFPLLTPLAFDPGHPFPFISNRSQNFAVVVRHNRRTKFARVKIPDGLPRFVPVPSTEGPTFAFLEDVIRLNLGELFPDVDVVDAHLFRVIRDSDIEVQEDGADDLLESMDRSLRLQRLGQPSLLQVEPSMPGRVLKILIENFEIEDDIVMRSSDRLGFSDWMTLCRLPHPSLKDAPFVARTLWDAAHHDPSVFDEIRERDRTRAVGRERCNGRKLDVDARLLRGCCQGVTAWRSRDSSGVHAERPLRPVPGSRGIASQTAGLPAAAWESPGGILRKCRTRTR